VRKHPLDTSGPRIVGFIGAIVSYTPASGYLVTCPSTDEEYTTYTTSLYSDKNQTETIHATPNLTTDMLQYKWSRYPITVHVPNHDTINNVYKTTSISKPRQLWNINTI